MTINFGNNDAIQVNDIYGYFYGREMWHGISADQSGNDWSNSTTFTPFVATSGNSIMGSEIKVIGTSDTPFWAGTTKYSIGTVLVTAADNDTPWRIRFVYGSGTFAQAGMASQLTEIIVQTAVAGENISGSPFFFRMPLLNAGTDKVWCTVANATDSDTISFFVGLHEY